MSYAIQANIFTGSLSESITLTQPSPPNQYLSYDGRDFQLNNGWIAFTKFSPLGTKQVWLRAPTGDQRQVTFFGTASYIDSLGPNGEVVLINTDHYHRYLSLPNNMPLSDIGWGTIGKSQWIDGQLFRVLGRLVFRVVPYRTNMPFVLANESGQ